MIRLKEKVPEFVEVQRSRKKKKKEKRRRKKRKQGRITFAIDSYTVRRSFFSRSLFVHRSFFVLHPVHACFKGLNLIYVPLVVPFIVCAYSSPSSIIGDIFFV